MLSAESPSKPPLSPSTITASPLSSSSPQNPAPQIPISWPSNGELTDEWIQDLTCAFDWSSKNLQASDFPSVFPVSVFDSLVLKASKILHAEPNCVTVNEECNASTPVVVVGDVHGQLHDVISLLQDAGFPSKSRFFVFNGDYVDRGAWGLETFLILLAWKPGYACRNKKYVVLLLANSQVLLPHRVFLLRGNHESKYCTSVYGFEQEVMVKYGPQGKHVYRKCLGCFEGLPLASIIAGCVFTAHGGLFRSMPSPFKKHKKGKKNRRTIDTDASSLTLGSLEELSRARRIVLDPPWEGLNLIPGDVLWSDPSMSPGLSPNKERGIGLIWGPDCTEEFLKKNHFKLIIRSHEGPDAREKRPGLTGMQKGYTIDHEVESGKLITLFSAPDYPQFQATEERYNNMGAYVVLEPPDFASPRFHSFEAVKPRPKIGSV
ncbi:Serine/threonine-protein phosphatase 7 [Asimina triloba]